MCMKIKGFIIIILSRDSRLNKVLDYFGAIM